MRFRSGVRFGLPLVNERIINRIYRLALTQLRLVMVKLLWNFDVELRPESKTWVSHEGAVCTLFRDKAPLWVDVRAVDREKAA